MVYTNIDHIQCKKIVLQRARYCYLVEKLPAEVVKEVTDILKTMPEENCYDKLKMAIIKQTGISNETMLRDLFTWVELGDWTPSQLLRHMKTLLDTPVMAENILWRLWLDKLPNAMTQILPPMAQETELEKLADSADRIHVGFRDRGGVNVLTPQPTNEQLQAMVASLAKEMQSILDLQKTTTNFS